MRAGVKTNFAKIETIISTFTLQKRVPKVPACPGKPFWKDRLKLNEECLRSLRRLLHEHLSQCGIDLALARQKKIPCSSFFVCFWCLSFEARQSKRRRWCDRQYHKAKSSTEGSCLERGLRIYTKQNWNYV